jgi:Tol biopolymer transport system component
VEDVFVVDRATDTVERVSVSSSERQQEVAVAAPFSQVSDISADGRYVVFDSDDAGLVAGDRNQDTDVFVRDRRSGRTTRASVSSLGLEGSNDSFNPSISANGAFVTFSSFAENLAPGTPSGVDVFARDLRGGSTASVGVSSRGAPRAKEAVSQLLQRPQISGPGDVIAFTSTAGNLVVGDANALEDVFVRILTPPRARFAQAPSGTVRTARPAFRLRADDRVANRFLCTIDGRRFECGRQGRVPAVGNGPHVLRVRAGGPGMHFERGGATRRFTVAGVGARKRPLIRPSVTISQPTRQGFGGNVVRGRARGGAVRVEVMVASPSGDTCRFFDGQGYDRRDCRRLLFVIAEGTTRWQLRLPSVPKGVVVVRARAIDSAGNRSRMVERGVRN